MGATHYDAKARIAHRTQRERGIDAIHSCLQSQVCARSVASHRMSETYIFGSVPLVVDC